MYQSFKTTSTKPTGIKPKGGGFLGAVGTVSTAAGILQSIVPKAIAEKTIGAALKHGLNCWGASVNPDVAQRNIELWGPRLVDAAEYALRANDSDLQTRINDFHKTYYHVGVKHRWWIERGGARDCTKNAIQLEMDALLEIKNKAMQAFETEVASRGHRMTTATPISINIPANKSIDLPPTTWKVEQFKVELVEKSIVAKAAGIVSGSDGGSNVIGMVATAAGLYLGRKTLMSWLGF